MTVELRSSRLTNVRAKAGTGTFEARAVRYGGPPDDLGSIWAPACFNEGLAQRLPVIAFAHNWADPIGRATGWRDAPDGVYLTARLDIFNAVPSADRVHAQLLSGTLTDVSVGFSVPRGGRRDPTPAEQRQWPGVREVITKAVMDELSVVLRGAVSGAEIVSVRSRQAQTPEARHLAQLLADGRISGAQYEQRMRAEREIDEALEIVARRRRQDVPMTAEEALQRVARWRNRR